MPTTEVALVRKVACPSCGNRDHLEIIERSFHYRSLVVDDQMLTAAPREEATFVQEVAVFCRTCRWMHNLRDCKATLREVLTGEARCKHG